MSITFYPEIAPVIGYRLVDHLGGISELFAEYAEAVARLDELHASDAVLPGCTDPESARAYGATIEAVTSDGEDVPDLNVSNANAATLLDVLGFSGECSGACSAEDFLGRVLTAEALSPQDAGVPAHQVGASPRVIDCGRRAGYIQERLEELRVIAEWARAHDRRVQWA
ncbi:MULTISPECIES: hypothetical protein [unclassified Rhodococcus (in: high G+C Gram-positive bacteria)]|uniref:hypothetical protein n=1 Tax=unclassified Rhodococcus (in: high G+C Gram-positive bacteria) TaxID=192944 RepID=UPI0009EF5002|nr:MULTISPECIES: hypothetical protein [unclassified Rhodococcus (in: high G+C Gram-positive bacteria)]